MNELSEAALGSAIRGVIDRVRARSRQLTYEQVEEDTTRLAAMLVEAFGHEEVRGFRYVGIPRGGLIVLGLLAYVLDLKTRAFRADGDEPLVVVDDISLSGNRFGRHLRNDPSERVVFAHLYSHPDLRKAIRDRQPRVIACLAARDLYERGPEVFGDSSAYEAWKGGMLEGLQEPRYWVGLTERVTFPWGAPALPVLNAITGQREDVWHLAPPDRHLKSMGSLGLPPRADLRRTWRSPDHVIYQMGREDVTLCHLGTERVFRLEGVAFEMWRALAAYGDPAAVVAHLQEVYDIDGVTAERDLEALLGSLEGSGLVERSEPQP